MKVGSSRSTSPGSRRSAGSTLTGYEKTIYDPISWRRFIRSFWEITAGNLYAGLNKMRTGTSARGTPP
nr:hypothetical protein [Methanoculleus marisnigri]